MKTIKEDEQVCEFVVFVAPTPGFVLHKVKDIIFIQISINQVRPVKRSCPTRGPSRLSSDKGVGNWRDELLQEGDAEGTIFFRRGRLEGRTSPTG